MKKLHYVPRSVDGAMEAHFGGRQLFVAPDGTNGIGTSLTADHLKELDSPRHVREVCMVGSRAKTCRYLILTKDGFECAKLVPELKAWLDSRVAASNMVAQGDHCEGKTDL